MIDLSMLKKYPNVQRYVADYFGNEGMGPGGGRLPDLIIWFRETLEKNDIDIPDYFDWDDDLREDFYSWGHNSRWGNTFMVWLSPGELEDQLGTIADIAAEYGDPNIEETYPINNNEN